MCRRWLWALAFAIAVPGVPATSAPAATTAAPGVLATTAPGVLATTARGVVATVTADPPAGPSRRPYVEIPPHEPPPVRREAAAAPLVWSPVLTDTFESESGRPWTVTVEQAVIGWAIVQGRAGEIRRPIEQTRLRFQDASDGRVLAFLQHLANTEVAILRPGDTRLVEPAPSVEDPLLPWPNTARLSIHELDAPIDLNQNRRRELVVNRSAAVGHPSARGLLLVEADGHGEPRLVAPEEFVGTIRFDEANITGLRFARGDAEPTVEAEFLPLRDCRFLAQLGIHGETPCEACCDVPVVLRPDYWGEYHPVYDRPTHGMLLSLRFRALATILQKEPDEPLSSDEQATLARLAAMYYMTGAGADTRGHLEEALGGRADQPAVRLLLSRLDRYFLLESGAHQDSRAR